MLRFDVGDVPEGGFCITRAAWKLFKHLMTEHPASGHVKGWRSRVEGEDLILVVDIENEPWMRQYPRVEIRRGDRGIWTWIYCGTPPTKAGELEEYLAVSQRALEFARAVDDCARRAGVIA